MTEASKVSNVTAENYLEKVTAFAAANGLVKGEWPTLRRSDRQDDGPWLAWIEYWKDLKRPMGFTLRLKDRRDGVITVPTRWPHQFDADRPKDFDFRFKDEKDPPPSTFQGLRSQAEIDNARAVVQKYRDRGLITDPVLDTALAEAELAALEERATDANS